MECSTVKRRVSAYVDNAVSENERREIRLHLNACNSCARDSQHHQRVRETLRALPQRAVPPDVSFRLRVAASKARMDAACGTSPWTQWRRRVQLSLTQLMRPVALPAVGGFCAAVLLFGVLMPTFMPAFAMNRGVSPWDVPTMLMTEPMLKCMAPIAFGEGDAVVDLKIDDQGRIVSYVIVSAPGQKGERMRHTIENNLLFTEFWPATSFGKPITGTIRISFRSTAGIVVKG